MELTTKQIYSAITAFIVCSTFAFCPAASALDTSQIQLESNTKIHELMKLNPGASEDEITTAIEEIAKQRDISTNDALNNALEEAQAAVDSAKPTPLIASSSGNSANYILGRGNNTGDIFYTPYSTAGIDHGHVGIYSSPTTIIEAPGPGKKSHEVLASTVWVSKGAVKQSVRTAQYRRDAAAGNARNYLNRDYNYVFVNNKNQNGSMNCSQLVWAAYYYGPGIDLDSNGGSAVYPSDIRDSSLTTTYQTI